MTRTDAFCEYFNDDNVAKSGMSAVELVLLTIVNFANPISINDKTYSIRL